MLTINPEKCSSCMACKVACSLRNFKVCSLKKSFIRILENQPYNEMHVCTQCGKCAEVCPEKAISKKGSVWLIDKNKCTGCGICEKECPEQVIVMHESKAWKCIDCGECAKHCTVGALE